MANILSKTTFENAPLQTMDSEQWKQLWDNYGFGRYNHGGGKVPRRGASVVDKDGEKAIEMRFAKYDPSFNQSANSNGLQIWQSEPLTTAKELFIEYDHQLGENFSFGGEINDGRKEFSGGKMGLGIQTINTTTNSKPPLDQFVVTLMWRDGQEGEAELEPYVYHSDQNGTNPDEEKTNYFIKPGDRHVYGLHWKIEGYVALYVDKVKIWERNDYKFSNKEEIPMLVSVSNFNGGSGKGWAHHNDCEAYLYSATLYDSVPYNDETEETPISKNSTITLDIDIELFKQQLIQKISQRIYKYLDINVLLEDIVNKVSQEIDISIKDIFDNITIDIKN